MSESREISETPTLFFAVGVTLHTPQKALSEVPHANCDEQHRATVTQGTQPYFFSDHDDERDDNVERRLFTTDDTQPSNSNKKLFRFDKASKQRVTKASTNDQPTTTNDQQQNEWSIFFVHINDQHDNDSHDTNHNNDVDSQSQYNDSVSIDSFLQHQLQHHHQ